MKDGRLGGDGGVGLSEDVAGDLDARRGRVGTSQILVGNAAGLPQAGQEGPVHGGRVIPDGVLAGEEEPGRVLDHVVALAGVAGNDGGGQDVVVVARRPARDKRV